MHRHGFQRRRNGNFNGGLGEAQPSVTNFRTHSRLGQMPKSKMGIFVCCVVTDLLLVQTPLQAESWPQRAVRLIVPTGAGSSVDVGARLFAERLGKRWNQAVVVENRPG